MGDGRYFMDGSRGGGAISLNENALFFPQFHLINLRCPGFDVCGDDQGIASTEKADRANRANGANGADGVDKADRIDGVNRTDGANGVDKSRTDAAEPDRVNGADGANGVDGADKANKGRADTEKPDRANKGGADSEQPENPRDLGLRDLRAKRQKMARQTVTRFSFFSFHIIFYLFFYSSESKTCGSA